MEHEKKLDARTEHLLRLAEQQQKLDLELRKALSERWHATSQEAASEAVGIPRNTLRQIVDGKPITAKHCEQIITRYNQMFEIKYGRKRSTATPKAIKFTLKRFCRDVCSVEQPDRHFVQCAACREMRTCKSIRWVFLEGEYKGVVCNNCIDEHAADRLAVAVSLGGTREPLEQHRLHLEGDGTAE